MQHPLQWPFKTRLPAAIGALALGKMQSLHLIILAEQIGKVHCQCLIAEVLPIVVGHHQPLMGRQRLLCLLDPAIGGNQQRAGIKLRVLGQQIGGMQRPLSAGGEVDFLRIEL